jgi:CRP-like cAMP-binding protein
VLDFLVETAAKAGSVGVRPKPTWKSALHPGPARSRLAGRPELGQPAAQITMNAAPENVGFYVWGLDKAAYGPVELPTLVAWIKDERVFRETWLFDERTGRWQTAGTFPELQPVFPKESQTAMLRRAGGEATGFKSEELRRIKILGTFNQAQLEKLAGFLEPERIRQWTAVVQQGDMSDSMYFILDGELRVSTRSGGSEKLLTTKPLGTGEFFGDIAFFDRGMRSADVIANVDSFVLKLSSSSFDRLCKEAPDLAAPFLLGIAKTMSARIRADNKHFTDLINTLRAAGH